MMSGESIEHNKRNILLLFDVDGTITPARGDIEDEIDAFLQDVRRRAAIGLVGGSDLNKITQQTIPLSMRSSNMDPIETCIGRYDYVFAENGLVAYKDGKFFSKQSLVDQLGEKRLQKFINFCLGYMSRLDLPIKRGNFIEFRNGLINVCPVGRSCSQSEREQFNAYDKVHEVRKKFINELEMQFGPNSDEPLGLVFAIGGQISFDAFPKGWDKTFCLNLVGDSYQEIHFFGDKTSPGGNDHEIYSDPRVIGHSVENPEDTIRQLKELNL